MKTAIVTVKRMTEYQSPQWGIYLNGNLAESRRCAGMVDRKGGDPEEWPADLRVRQFPEVRA